MEGAPIPLAYVAGGLLRVQGVAQARGDGVLDGRDDCVEVARLLKGGNQHVHARPALPDRLLGALALGASASGARKLESLPEVR